MAKTKTTKKQGDGHMPDGSDMTFFGTDEVYGAADDARPSINLRDPRQVQAWLTKKAAMQKKPTKKGAK